MFSESKKTQRTKNVRVRSGGYSMNKAIEFERNVVHPRIQGMQFNWTTWDEKNEAREIGRTISRKILRTTIKDF